MHVVVVDDERRMAELIADYLAEQEAATTLCFDGLTGLAAARGPAVDAVVLDLMMPGMSGTEVCQQLRREGNDVPILMLTSRPEPTTTWSNLSPWKSCTRGCGPSGAVWMSTTPDWSSVTSSST